VSLQALDINIRFEILRVSLYILVNTTYCFPMMNRNKKKMELEEAFGLFDL
jgi:hypothetical protein